MGIGRGGSTPSNMNNYNQRLERIKFTIVYSSQLNKKYFGNTTFCGVSLNLIKKMMEVMEVKPYQNWTGRN